MNKKFTILTAALALLTILAIPIGMRGQSRTETTTTYTFTTKSWTATSGGVAANWTSGKDGAGFSNNGIQVTTNTDYNGANGTSPVSFTNISKIVATYNTNKSAGGGTIEAKIGTNDAVSKTWAYGGTGDGRTANYTVQWDYATPQTGNVKITCNTTTNSIYLVSVAITTTSGGGSDPSISASNVDIAYNATEGSISYTINNVPDPAGTLTAAIDGTPTIESFALGTVTASAVPFTCVANNEVAARTAVVTLTYTYGSPEQTVTKNVTITQAGNPDAVNNISDITEVGTAYKVKGTVVATNSRGFVIGDGTGYVYYYKGSDAGKTVGDKVKVSGTTGTYGHIIQFTSSATITEETTSNYDDTPAATVITTVPDYSTGYHLSTYLEFEGALAESSGNYYITVGGTQIQVSYPTTAQVTTLTSLNGKMVHVKGYFSGINSSDKFTVMLESAVEVTTPSITVASYSIDVDANEHDDGSVTVTYANITTVAADIQFYEEDGVTEADDTYYDWLYVGIDGSQNIEYIVEENTGSERTACFKVWAYDDGLNTVYSDLVTITQAAPAAPAATYTQITGIDDLVSGKHYIIAAVKNTTTYALGKAGTNNRPGVAVTVESTTITGNDDVCEVVIIGPDADGFYSLYDVANDGYLYAASSGSNYLKSQKPNNDNGRWAITFDEGEANIVAQGSNTRNIMRFNKDGSNAIFSCYGSGQQPVYLYAKNGETTVSYTKEITGFGGDNTVKNGWYLIAPPVGQVTPTADNNFLANTHDLYAFDQSETEEWRNYKQGAFNLVSGHGYLYANSNTVTLTFEGMPYVGNGQVFLAYEGTAEFPGYNLIGNPFATTATIPNTQAYYTLNSTGSELIAGETYSVAAMEGIFVQAIEAGQSVTFTPSAKANTGHSTNLIINLNGNDGQVIDRTIVRFDDGQTLPKFMLNPQNTKLYIPHGTQDFAVVRSNGENEMPINFKASKNGNYTLSVNAKDLEMDYMHLIDNMTGADVDLLANPSYTFDARTSDYASRFRLVFSANDENGASTGSATFAYFNGSEWVVNSNGNATLQVVDVMGRVLSSENVNGNHTMNLNLSTGVYMLRLVNGNDVKTQKIVVR